MTTKLIQINSDDGFNFLALYDTEIEDWLPVREEDIDQIVAKLQARNPDEIHHDRSEFLGFKWYTTKEAVKHAEEYGYKISVRTIRKAAQEGKIRAEKHGRDWKIEAMRFRGWLVEGFQAKKRNGLAES